MRKFAIAIASVFAIAAVPMTANAAPCKDAKGKFIKCPPAPVAAPAVPKAAPAAPKVSTPAVPAVAAGGIKKDAKGRCHGAKGRFVKCPA